MRPPFSLEAVGVQLTLQQTLQLGDDRAEQQIDHGDLAVDGQKNVGAGGNALAGHEQFGDRDVRCQRGVLDHADERVGQGGHRRAQRLRQHDAAHDLPPGHAHAVTGFQLALGHAFQRAAHGLGAVGTLIEGEGDDGGGEGVQHDAQAGQAVKDDEQLHQQRCAADDPDVEPGQLAQHRHIGVLHQRHHHGQHHGKAEGDEGQRDGHGEARRQDTGQRFPQNAGRAVGKNGKVAVKAAEEGATIALSNTAMALRMGTLDKLAEQINAPIIAADATSVEDLEKVFTEAQEKLGGKIDFVLHSVAMSPNVRKHRTYDDLDYNFLNKTLDISAISFHKMLQVAKKLDAINEWGSVVALSYVASQRTFFGYNDMADAKSMLESIARSFGYIYGREKHVRINTISQSPTATTAGKGIKDIDNMMDFADKMSPLGNAVAEDCANYCVMMFSDFTRKVTMQNLFHDGGFSSMGMSLRAMNQYAKDLTPYEDKNGKVIYG